VLINDAFIDRMNMECLFQLNEFLNDQVIAFKNDQFIALLLLTYEIFVPKYLQFLLPYLCRS
jgi:hypothetical protein